MQNRKVAGGYGHLPLRGPLQVFLAIEVPESDSSFSNIISSMQTSYPFILCHSESYYHYTLDASIGEARFISVSDLLGNNLFSFVQHNIFIKQCEIQKRQE